MPNSQSQMINSNLPPGPPGFQPQGTFTQNQLYQQSMAPPQQPPMQGGNFQSQQIPQQMVLNPAGAPISSAMRIQNAKSSRITWRNVHDLDIEDLKKSNDIETLESYLPNLLDSIVTQEEYEKLKPEALVKLLQICQMSLQYFDYTQDYLENLTNETQDEINKLLKKTDEDKVILKKSKREIAKMKNDIDVKKEAIKKYKEFLKQRPQYKCHICVNKFFQNEDYLDSHIKRRHAHVLPMNANHPNFAVMQNMVFAQQLQQERSEFERQQRLLHNNEKFKKDEVLDKLDSILQKNRAEQIELQLEMQRKLQDLESHQNDVISKKQQENDFQRQQIVDLMKNMNKIHDEITNLKYREVVVQQTTQNEQRESQLQQLLQKQNELFEKNQKLKQQQIEKEIEKERKLMDEKKRLEEIKLQKQQKEEQEYNEGLVKMLIGQNNYNQRTSAADRKQIPSEIKNVMGQISEIRGNYNNGNQIDKDTIEELDNIYLGSPQKSNSNQNGQANQRGNPKENQQTNKFNSIASNMMLQGHPHYKQNSKQDDEDDVPEEGEIHDEFYQSDEDEEASFDSNENDVSKDRGFNNQCEQEKEILEIANHKGKQQHPNKNDNARVKGQVDQQINQKLKEQGINVQTQNLAKMSNNEIEQILDKVNKGDKNTGSVKKQSIQDFDNDFEQSKEKLDNPTHQSGKGQLYSSKRNQLEESSQNYDESGYYNGSKGRTYELQSNPQTLNKQMQSFGDSYTETLYQNKNHKKFAYEDSDEF